MCTSSSKGKGYIRNNTETLKSCSTQPQQGRAAMWLWGGRGGAGRGKEGEGVGMVTEHRSKHGAQSQTSASTTDRAHNTTPECNLLKRNDIKDGFSPLKTNLELWFTGPAMPRCPPRHPAAGPGGRCTERREDGMKEEKVSHTVMHCKRTPSFTFVSS